MNIHPLQSYYNLLEERNLLGLISWFHNSETFIKDKLIENPLKVYSWNPENKIYTVTDELTDDVYELSLPNYIANRIVILNNELKQNIRSFLWNNDKKASDEYCRKISFELSKLKINCQSLKLKESEIVSKLLDDIIFFAEENSENILNVTRQKKKLVWKGNINTLVTIFFDLSQNTNNLKYQFLEYDRQGLTDFIVDSFLDNKGEKLESSTVYRILDSSPEDLKKAKKRYILPE